MVRRRVLAARAALAGGLALGLACAAQPAGELPRPASGAGAQHFESLGPVRLAGTWLRPTGGGPGAAGPRRGLVLGEGGALGLLGSPSLQGISWSRRGETLLLRTRAGLRAQSATQSLRIAQLGPGRLELVAAKAGASGWAGSYRRDDDAAALVTGRVMPAQQLDFAAPAAIRVELARLDAQGRAGERFADQTLPFPRGAEAVDFFLVCARSRLPAEGARFGVVAELTAGGVRFFETPQPLHVDLRAPATGLELRLAPVGAGRRSGAPLRAGSDPV